MEKQYGMRTQLNPHGKDINEQTHLSRHKITEIARAKMIDWMFEVLKVFKMSEQTFYLSVQYLDRFIAKS